MMINNRYISAEKEETANKINELLLTNLLDHERVCINCGKKLSWDYPSEMYKPIFRGNRRKNNFSRSIRKRRNRY